MKKLSAFVAVTAFAAVVTVAAGPVPADNPLFLSGTHLGGTGTDTVRAARIGPDGALWICGGSTSHDFPGAERPQAEFASGDAYVIRLDPVTRQVLSSVWIGGIGADSVIALEFDAAGAAFVAGLTESSDFPYTAGLAGAGMNRPATFVARVAADARSLDWVYALGGSQTDEAHGLCLTDGGDPVVVGHTTSVDYPWTTPLGEARGDRDFGDIFVTRLRADGSGIVFSSLIGGAAFDSAAAAVAVPGGIVIAGNTNSFDFPDDDAFLPGFSPPSVAFVLEIDQEGTEIRRTKYFGNRDVKALSVSGGSLLLLASTHEAMPPGPDGRPTIVLPPAADTSALLLKMDAATWTPSAGALYGGSGDEYDLAMSPGGDGTVWLSGSTRSADLVTPGAIRPRSTGGEDAFLAAFDATDLSLTFGTWLGGVRREIGEVVAPAGDGTAWLLGSTNSPDFPVVEPLGEQQSDESSYDLFAAHVAMGDSALAPLAPLGLTGEATDGHHVKLTWTSADAAATGIAIDRTDGLAWRRLTVIAPDATEWTDSSVVADHGYTYEIQALSAAGGSPRSNATHAITPATVNFAITSGRFKSGRFGSGGKLQLTGTIAPLAGDALDVRASGLELVFFTSFGPDTVIRIPAGDPSWRTKRGKLTWRSGATRFGFDPVMGQFELRTTGHPPAVGAGDALSAQVVLAQDAGTTANVWHPFGRRETRTP